MQAIIVAGGRGERLKPLTNKVPKPMVEVGGKSILEHTINLLKSNGVTDLILALCYLPNVIVNYFGDGKKFGVSIRYTFEEPSKPLGTAGAIKESEKYLKGDFIVTYADILRKLDISEMIKELLFKKSLATINVYRRYGIDPKSMVVFDKNNLITAFKERPSLDEIRGDFVWANGSFYVLNKNVFDYIKDSKSIDFGRDVFPAMIKNEGKIYAFKSDRYFIDIGNLDKLEKARKEFIF